MKFRQRQIALTFFLLCVGLFFVLYNRTPEAQELLTAVDKKFGPPTLSPLPIAGDEEEEEEEEEEDAKPLERPERTPVPDPQPKGQAVEKTGGADIDQKPRRKEDGAKDKPIVFMKRSPGSECPKVLRPIRVTRENQTFQGVDGKTALYVFSAFLDESERVVRVIALNSLRDHKVTCLLWHEEGPQELALTKAAVSPLPEGHGRRYSAAYIACPLSPDQRDDPYAVSITSSDCHSQADVTPPSNVLLVQRAKEVEHNFTVCVTPLNYKYSRAYELVEMMELNRLLGADHFTFYAQSIGPNVAEVLRWYQDQGLVTVVNWDLPVKVDHWPPLHSQAVEVHYFAQLASHNDCLNRHRGASRYLVYQDLDEFIIPKKNMTWAAMLDSLPKNYAALLFKCQFFRKDWPLNDEAFYGRDVANKFKSIVLLTDKREQSPYPANQRAKFIVDPHGVQTVGIHNIWKYRPGHDHSFTQVWQTTGLMHHYRNWELPKDGVAGAVRDTDMYRFKDALLKRLSDRWAQLPHVPLDIPQSSYGQL